MGINVHFNRFWIIQTALSYVYYSHEINISQHAYSYTYFIYQSKKDEGYEYK